MNIFRAENPQVILLIKEYFVDDPGVDTDQVAAELMAFMASSPDKVLVILITDDEGGKVDIKGFLIGWIPAERNYLMLHQAKWIDLKFPEKFPHAANSVFSRAEAFAEFNELKSIRAETSRSPESLLRKYGFIEFAKILVYNLGD